MRHAPGWRVSTRGVLAAIAAQRRGVGVMQRWIGALAAAAAATLALACPAANAADTPQVDGAVQVTSAANPFRAYASPSIAVDPRDPDTIVVADGEARSSGCAVQFSTNAGLSWSSGGSPLPISTSVPSARAQWVVSACQHSLGRSAWNRRQELRGRLWAEG
jgi:hypothetical protein